MASNVADAYNQIAPTYDGQLEGDEWMRALLWARYRRLFRPGEHVLDLACGTGIDTIFLAQRGIHVTAIDISPAMIRELRSKLADGSLPGRVTVQVLDLADSAAWPAGPFDGMISAFAGLNTVPDLAAFAAQAASHLRPDGRVLVHLLNRASLWEWLSLIWRGEWRAAQQLHRRRERAFTIAGEVVTHRLYTPLAAYEACFALHFRLCRAYALGVLRPPQALRLPASLTRLLGWLERGVAARQPLTRWGRFFVLELAKRSSA